MYLFGNKFLGTKYFRLFIPIFLFSFWGCDKTTEPTSDPTATIKGSVVSLENNEPLDSVLIGFINPGAPDSLIFVGDSVITSDPNLIAPATNTLNGIFYFSFAFVYEPPVDYEQMFAYKPGKKLWRFNSSLDTIYQLISNTDSIKIRMIDSD